MSSVRVDQLSDEQFKVYLVEFVKDARRRGIPIDDLIERKARIDGAKTYNLRLNTRHFNQPIKNVHSYAREVLNDFIEEESRI